LDPISAQMLLLKCHGNEIWDEHTCRSSGVPQAWIDELIENYESGFDSDRNTIYADNQLVNQYRGSPRPQTGIQVGRISWYRLAKGNGHGCGS
jgi:hypothetical protein